MNYTTKAIEVRQVVVDYLLGGMIMANNKTLSAAKRARNDEFYTLLPDIEKEVSHYWDQLRGELIYCNCDDYRWSNFYKYFHDNFEAIGISGLLCSGLNAPTVYYDGEHLYKVVGYDNLKFQDGLYDFEPDNYELEVIE